MDTVPPQKPADEVQLGPRAAGEMDERGGGQQPPAGHCGRPVRRSLLGGPSGSGNTRGSPAGRAAVRGGTRPPDAGHRALPPELENLHHGLAQNPWRGTFSKLKPRLIILFGNPGVKSLPLLTDPGGGEGQFPLSKSRSVTF